MAKLTFFFAITAMAATLFFSAGAVPFQGLADIHFKSASQDKSVHLMIKGDNVRIENLSLGDPNDYAVFNGVEKKIYLISPKGKNYYILPLAFIQDQGVIQDATVAKGKKNETLLGFDCLQITVITKKRTLTIWTTDKLGFPLFFMAGIQKNINDPDALLATGAKYLREQGIIPLKMVEKDLAGKEVYLWEILSLTPKELSDAIFTIPAGYVNVSDQNANKETGK